MTGRVTTLGGQTEAEQTEAVLDALAAIPDESIGWRGASPGPMWEPTREAERVRRGLEPAPRHRVEDLRAEGDEIDGTLELLTEDASWDAELQALVAVGSTLETLDPAARERVIRWARSRYLPGYRLEAR